MKIIILGFSKIKYMPYMNFYLESINTVIHDVHLLYWNRDLKQENVDGLSGITLHEFRCYQEDDASKISKIGSFLKFRNFARRVIQTEKFDFIIFLHSIPGILIADSLTRRYRNRYIFDYRDFTYEGFPPYKKVIGDLVKCSYATFVSSDAFRRFLPQSEQHKIYTSHNLLMDALKHRDDKSLYGVPSDRIRFVFWGFLRHEEENREIIRKIAADSRFELHYYGREQQAALNLKTYAKKIGAANIYFHGEYRPEDRYGFVLETDMLHNLYFDKNAMLAMSNKYYDGIIFRIPQICFTGSYMGEMAEQAGVGICANPAEASFTDDIHAYFSTLNAQLFQERCDQELRRVVKEYEDGKAVLANIPASRGDKTC